MSEDKIFVEGFGDDGELVHDTHGADMLASFTADDLMDWFKWKEATAEEWCWMLARIDRDHPEHQEMIETALRWSQERPDIRDKKEDA
jgi:hypothetical protein